MFLFQNDSELISHYLEQETSSGPEPDLSDCRVALDKLSPVLDRVSGLIESAENLTHLIELELDLGGVDSLVQPQRVL